MLIVHGRQDPIPYPSAEQTAALIPGALLEPIEDCGHVPWMEQPGRAAPAHRGVATAGAMIPGFETTLWPGSDRLIEEHAAELPQKDELCGAFCAALALRAAGHPVPSQDVVAEAAGSCLSPAAQAQASLPLGEPGRRDYRVALPTVEDAWASGTTAAGTARAIHVLSDGDLVAIGLRGPWTVAHVHQLLSLGDITPGGLSLIANVATAHFWGGRPTPPELLRYLTTGDPAPAADWDVGHFVCLVGAVRGSQGTLIAVADTYSSLGWQGVHFQPVERMAPALERPGMPPGGVFAVVGSADETRVREWALAAGFDLGFWDNTKGRFRSTRPQRRSDRDTRPAGRAPDLRSGSDRTRTLDRRFESSTTPWTRGSARCP